MSDETVITLNHPITYTADKFDGGGEREVTELRLPARIKARHLRAMDKATGQMGQVLALLQALTGLPQAAVDELDSADLEQVTEALAGPLGARPGTGPTS